MQRNKSALSVRFWALSDQGVVSLGNFLTNLILARSLPPAEYGIYALIYNAILSVNTIHAALVTYTLAVRGAPMSNAELRRWVSGAMTVSVVLSLLLIGVVSIATSAVGRPTLAPFVAAAILLWQLQETIRTAFFAHFRQRSAILGDMVSYLGQAAVFLFLSRHHLLTIRSAFVVIASTSALALLLQIIQFEVPLPDPRVVKQFVAATRMLGIWAGPSRVVTFITFQSFPWTLFFAYGPAASAIFQAMASAVAAGNPVLISTSNLIIATMASSKNPLRFSAALKHASYGWGLVAPLFLFVSVFPELTLRILYGSHSEYIHHQSVLRMMALAYALEAVAMLIGSIISGVADTRSLFQIQAVGLVVGVVIGIPLAAFGGVLLAVTGYVVSQIGRVLYALWSYSKVRAREQSPIMVEVSV